MHIPRPQGTLTLWASLFASQPLNYLQYQPKRNDTAFLFTCTSVKISNRVSHMARTAQTEEDAEHEGVCIHTGMISSLRLVDRSHALIQHARASSQHCLFGSCCAASSWT